MNYKKNIAITSVVVFVAAGLGLLGLVMTGGYKVAMGTVAAPVMITILS